ncbi:hypothetical protein CL622_05405, partial [archaeon]|nr:hypothetical protein [archaeon]
PKIDWRKFIRATTVDLFSRKDYMWNRGNRLFTHMDLYLPSLLGEANTTLAIAVDTSASITKDILTDFTTEMKGIVELADKTVVFACDAKVHHTAELTTFSDILKETSLVGGGGTSFVPVFEKIEEMKIAPDVLIYLTDGYGRFPDYAPPYPVIFAALPNTLPVKSYPFGQVVILENNIC